VIDLEDWTIQLGVTRRNSFTYSGQKVKVKAVIPHPQYNMAIAHDNDKKPKYQILKISRVISFQISYYFSVITVLTFQIPRID